MDLNSIHLSGLWLWTQWLYWPILAWAIYRAPWSILLQKDSSNILFATCATLFLFWHLKVDVANGLAIHLLGSSILTLMFRWQVALMANALILTGITLSSNADLAAFAMNGLMTGVIPVAITYLIWRINERFLPPNYFVYIFVSAFFAAGLSILSTGVISYEILRHIDSHLIEETLHQYILIFIPIMYPEAFITGGVISVFVIYKPEWISTFDDRRYLHNR